MFNGGESQASESLRSGVNSKPRLAPLGPADAATSCALGRLIHRLSEPRIAREEWIRVQDQVGIIVGQGVEVGLAQLSSTSIRASGSTAKAHDQKKSLANTVHSTMVHGSYPVTEKFIPPKLVSDWVSQRAWGRATLERFLYTQWERNRIQMATLEKTQLTELCIHFWPDIWSFMVGLCDLLEATDGQRLSGAYLQLIPSLKLAFSLRNAALGW
ncbi:predicted protein [Histoplasma capsulatum var. duboisii H88]|uniref:Predicted protein n=1 Tax=Ajellomyces capsulatus (strain H88) TaxID=544711 RepID=F0UW29_AJEC8|nr:predicted protein [Histoplasma capsulatum var. duboisii H88]